MGQIFSNTDRHLICPVQQCIEASAGVVFGSPGKNCDGSGICMVAPRNSAVFSRIRCAAYPAAIRIIEDKYLKFSFLKNDILFSKVAVLFRSKRFEVEERFQLPASIARIWNKKPVWVEAGLYPVIDSNDDQLAIFFEINT